MKLLSDRKINLMKSALAIVVIAFAILNSGCSSLKKDIKGFVSGQEKPQFKGPKYSENENLRYNSDKKYRRMNKEKFEEEADVASGAGSLWVMEGQGAYLFAQNQTRVLGDLLNVKLEGAPKQQLQSKVKVISKLLERLDSPRGLASAGGGGDSPAPAPAAAAEKGKASDKGGEKNPEGEKAQADKPDPKNDPISTIGAVPTRIVEQLKDGSYRVRGLQPFMIGKREYRVIVTGVVRPEDFDDAGIEASKLLDPQFDIVSARKGVTL